MTDAPRHVFVVGAGPAGLTAAVELSKRNINCTVVEKLAIVGGIARTERYKGYHFDIGGHRFFTKIGEVEAWWKEMLASEFLTRSRISRIYYRGRFFDYPLRALNALSNLGVFTSARVLGSYLWSRLFPYPKEDTFEEWVSNRFGRQLYRIFFKTYTEKVWGIPCSEIRAEWAAQRIRGLSLSVAVKNALFGRFLRGSGPVVKTLIEEFQYPRLGPGMMWEAAARLVQQRGGRILMNTDVVRLHCAGGLVRSAVVRDLTTGAESEIGADAFVSSMPIAELIQKLSPAAPPPVIEAARGLTYRDFITVVLIVDHPDLFPDNWIYVHSEGVRVGRIQNFKNWSPEMVPDPARTALGLEYFCTEGDDLWSMTDAELVDLGKREMEELGLLHSKDVVDGTVVRQLKAYPVYNSTYGDYLRTIQEHLAGISNLHTIGRNGLHKYNNQDHSMLTAMLAVRNVLGESHDVWNVNTERSYHEEVRVAQPPPGAR